MNKAICIFGPTASGKTDLGIALATHFKTEIISADSVQLYRGLDIGSAKPSLAERGGIVHHMLDCIDIDAPAFSVSAYQRLAYATADSILARGMLPIIVGGSGLYLDVFTRPLTFAVPSDPKVRQAFVAAYAQSKETVYAQLQRVDPSTAARIHLNDQKRIVRALEVYSISGKPLSAYGNDFQNAAQQDVPYHTVNIGLTMERAELYSRIDQRVEQMLARGLVREARDIFEKYPDPTLPAMQSIGYKQLFAFFSGEISMEKAVEAIKRDTRRFAKRQMTWFGKENDTKWYDVLQFKSMGALAAQVISDVGKRLSYQ